MNKEKFTEKSVRLVANAVRLASGLGHTYVGSEHILLALSDDDTVEAANILVENGVAYDDLRQEIVIVVGEGAPTSLNQRYLTPESRRILDDACRIAAGSKKKQAAPEHILAAIIRDTSCFAFSLIKKVGGSLTGLCAALEIIDSDELRAELYASVKPRASNLPHLFKYGRNLTDIVSLKKNDPLIGRSKEVERVLQVLSRRNKNNPCLIGEAGVGKTAIVEGVAELFARNLVPDPLKNKFIFALDLASMVSGAKYRGDFEERIKGCIEEAIKAGNIILFIDEIHTIVGAGATEGSIDAANIMKPQLARGELRIIGATTFDEYKRSIEKDPALERRFQPINVCEPGVAGCIEIIKGLKSSYESFHGISISNDIIEKTVKMSVRYISDRCLPDKAIDVLDEACACAKLRRSNGISKDSEYIDLSKKGVSLSDLSSMINREELCLTEEDLMSVISVRTGIPLAQITQDDADGIENLGKRLSEKVVGHDYAVRKITEAICRARSGLRDSRRPTASFLFAGPTGVGKTELAKALTECFYGSENDLIRVDMSEYMEKHSVSKLIGAPPGYAGYNETSGNLCERVRRNPYSLILFDEIEKADREVLNLLLQILDEGILTDSSMKRVSFKNCIIIMTSNAGAREIGSGASLGFTGDKDKTEHERVLTEIRKMFSPEFVNRIDEIVVFRQLEHSDLVQISRIMLDDLKKRAGEIGIRISYSPEVAEAVAGSKETDRYGARPIRRRVTELIENDLAQLIVSSRVCSGQSIMIDVYNSKIRIHATDPEPICI